MKVMISQPMRGKDIEDIRKKWNEVKTVLESQGDIVIDNITDFGTIDVNTTNISLVGLSYAINAMSRCDGVYFCKGWADARGCLVEHLIAREYGLTCIYE